MVTVYPRRIQRGLRLVLGEWEVDGGSREGEGVCGDSTVRRVRDECIRAPGGLRGAHPAGSRGVGDGRWFEGRGGCVWRFYRVCRVRE